MLLATIVEIEGRLVLRVTYNGKSLDYDLTENQVKLLSRQLINWLTR